MRMAEDDYSVSVGCLVPDYMSYRLQKAGYTWQISPTRNSPDNRVTNCLRKLCTEFEKRYGEQFANMCSDCEMLDLTADSYHSILDNLIDDGVNWGRVVGIFAFAGSLAVHWMQKGKTGKIDLIREWTCTFIYSRIENWVNENNGWRGLVEFYENGRPRQEQQQEQQQNNAGWSYLIGGALGAFALGALIVNRA